MTAYILTNQVQVGTTTYFPGMLINSLQDDVIKLTAAGAVLWPSTDATVAAIAAVVNKRRLQGAPVELLMAQMQAAINQAQGYLIGATGATGATGAAGPAGPAGATGATGATGGGS